MTRRDSIWMLGLGALPGASAETLVQTDLFVSGTGGYHTYRIPSLIRTRKGTLLAFCEGRRNARGDTGDIDIVLRRSTDRGRTWSGPVTTHEMGSDTIGNPCPVVERKSGAIHLLLTSNPGHMTQKQIDDQSLPGTRQVWHSQSSDDGITWSKAVEITAAVKQPNWTWYATGPGVGIQLRSGRLVVPCDHTVAGTKADFSHAIYSDDQGRTWKLGSPSGEGVNECQVVELRDGSLLMNMRSNHGRHRRAVSRSRDGGISWSGFGFDEALIEPVCQASLIEAGGVLLFSNPASTQRENMTIRASRDDGKTWPVRLVLQKGPSAYSCLAPVSRSHFGCLYERGEQSPYERITLALFRLSDLG